MKIICWDENVFCPPCVLKGLNLCTLPVSKYVNCLSLNVNQDGQGLVMQESKHWESLKSGDMAGLRAIYDLHVDALYRYGIMLIKDPDKVKDAIQEMFLSFWNNRTGLTIPASGKAYLIVSLRRRLFDKGPKSNLDTTPLEEANLDDRTTGDPESQWVWSEEEQERQQKLEQAMARISERQREIIHMKYFQQLDYDQIAQVMDLKYQSARNLVTRALAALRKEMMVLFLLLFCSL